MAWQGRIALNGGSVLGDLSAQTLFSAIPQINGMTNDLYNSRWAHNVIADGGALGNSNYATGGGQDDTTFIQNTINAAAAAGGFTEVIFPGNRTYRITAQLNVPAGMRLRGMGARDNVQQAPPTIQWTGSAGGTMIEVSTANAGIFMTQFENLCFRGRLNDAGEPAAIAAVKFAVTGGALGKLDSGVGFRDCWFQLVNGNFIELTANGATNLWIEDSRFDGAYNGYAINVPLGGSGKAFYCYMKNINYVGSTAGQGKGFINLDGENATANGDGYSMVIIDGLHTECNQNLIETYAAGTNPFDKRGYIRCGVKGTSGFATQQHKIYVRGWFNSDGAVSAYSLFQVTRTGGTDLDASDGVSFVIDGGSGISKSESGSGDAGTTQEVRMVGGAVPANRRIPNPGCYRHGRITWGYGKDNTGETQRSHYQGRPGSYTLFGVKHQAVPLADIGTAAAAGVGSEHCINDSNSSVRGNTAAAGGSTVVKVLSNGTNWIIQ